MKPVVEIKNFTVEEVAGLQDKLILRLQVLRDLVGAPIFVTSGVRIGDDGAHGTGRAVDISDNKVGNKVRSVWRHKVLTNVYAMGFKRVGDYDKHIHIDLDYTRDQNVTWWDVSD